MQAALRTSTLTAVPALRGGSKAARRRVGLAPPASGDGRNDGDWGARDATPGEIGSNFSEKVLGNWDTAHIIRGPDALDKIVGLHTQDCSTPPAPGSPPVAWLDATKNRNQVPGWRLEDDGVVGGGTVPAAMALVREWKARDAAAAGELVVRLTAAAAEAGHAPATVAADAGGEVVTARLTTPGLAGPGGLSINDFILAAKLNRVGTVDLEKRAKPKFWA